MSLKRAIDRLDKWGMTASLLCAIHCALVPFVFTMLPLGGLGFLTNPWIESTMICITIFLGWTSLGASYKNRHKRILPFLIFIAGLAFILIGHFLLNGFFEDISVPVGGLCIAGAHLINWNLNKKYFECSNH